MPGLTQTLAVATALAIGAVFAGASAAEAITPTVTEFTGGVTPNFTVN
ncbi:MAG: hypothetical protein QOK31_244, partial [Solirubrobacteraceae bacterium]|nr:hypothetical protein [Solirubrobacteraceae bacterium]